MWLLLGELWEHETWWHVRKTHHKRVACERRQVVSHQSQSRTSEILKDITSTLSDGSIVLAVMGLWSHATDPVQDDCHKGNQVVKFCGQSDCLFGRGSNRIEEQSLWHHPMGPEGGDQPSNQKMTTPDYIYMDNELTYIYIRRVQMTDSVSDFMP